MATHGSAVYRGQLIYPWNCVPVKKIQFLLWAISCIEYTIRKKMKGKKKKSINFRSSLQAVHGVALTMQAALNINMWVPLARVQVVNIFFMQVFFWATMLHYLLTIYNFAHSLGHGRGERKHNRFQSFKCSIFYPLVLDKGEVNPTKKKKKQHYLPSANSPNSPNCSLTSWHADNARWSLRRDLFSDFSDSPRLGSLCKAKKKKTRQLAPSQRRWSSHLTRFGKMSNSRL